MRVPAQAGSVRRLCMQLLPFLAPPSMPSTQPSTHSVLTGCELADLGWSLAQLGQRPPLSWRQVGGPVITTWVRPL